MEEERKKKKKTTKGEAKGNGGEKGRAGIRLRLFVYHSIFPSYIRTPLLHLWALPILGPVISDNVNDLVESPPQRMICDM